MNRKRERERKRRYGQDGKKRDNGIDYIKQGDKENCVYACLIDLKVSVELTNELKINKHTHT